MNEQRMSRPDRDRAGETERLYALLRADAQPATVPDGFVMRTMAAVRAAAAVRNRPAPVFAWQRPAWAAAVACIAVVLSFWGRGRIEDRTVAHAGAREAVSAAVAASDWIAAWGDGASDRITQPMHAEVENLVDDARRAATVLLAGLE